MKNKLKMALLILLCLFLTAGVSKFDDVETTGYVTIATGENFTVGTTQWNSGDSIDATKVADADIGDIDTLSGVWKVEPEFISGKTDVTSEDSDYIIIWDSTDSLLKKVDMGEVRGAGGGAPVNAEYIVVSHDATLTDERAFQAGEGIDTLDQGADSAFIVSGEDATDANKGIASFSSSHFSVSSGAVSLLTDGIDDTLIDWGTGANQVGAADMPNEDIGDIDIASGVWTIEPEFIADKTDVTATLSDYMLIWDATDSALKKVDLGETLGGGSSAMLGASGIRGVVDDATTSYFGIGRGEESTEANVDVYFPFQGVIKNFYTYVSQNNVGDTTTITVRLNGADTSIQTSYGASATGLQSDTSNTQAVVAGDRFSIEVTVPSVGGTKTVTIESWSFEIDQ